MGVNAPAVTAHADTLSTVSFQNNVLPIFVKFGCYDCHGGTNGLVVHTVADLLKGGVHGTVRQSSPGTPTPVLS